MCGRHCACEHFGSEVLEWSFAIMSPVYWRGVIAAGPNAICGPTLDQFVEIKVPEKHCRSVSIGWSDSCGFALDHFFCIGSHDQL